LGKGARNSQKRKTAKKNKKSKESGAGAKRKTVKPMEKGLEGLIYRQIKKRRRGEEYVQTEKKGDRTKG